MNIESSPITITLFFAVFGLLLIIGFLSLKISTQNFITFTDIYRFIGAGNLVLATVMFCFVAVVPGLNILAVGMVVFLWINLFARKSIGDNAFGRPNNKALRKILIRRIVTIYPLYIAFILGISLYFDYKYDFANQPQITNTNYSRFI